MNKTDVAETDRIYTIYTLEMGKIRVLAKSVRLPKAKLAGQLEPITEAEIFIAKTRGLGKITGTIVSGNFSRIKADLESMRQIFSIFKILERIISDQEGDKNIYLLLKDYLETMEKVSDGEATEKENKKSLVSLGFLFKFFSEMGYKVEVGGCVGCGKKLQSGKNYFSASRGGILCGDCAPKENMKIKIDDDSIKFIRVFLKNKIPNLIKLDVSRGNVVQIKNIFGDFLNWVFSENDIAKKGFLW